MPNDGYLYGDEETLKQSILSIQNFLRRIQTGGGGLGNSAMTIYAEVTAVVSDQEVKGIQKVWDSSLATPAYAAPEGTAITWDSDLYPGSTNYLEPNVFTDTPLAVGDVVEVIFYMDKSFTSRWKARIGGGGSSLIWLTTDNTGLSFANGAKYDFPSGTGTALTVDDTYYIATPWNTRIAAPNNFFGYFVQDGKNWYHGIQKFYLKPSEDYPSGAGAGIDAFTCYLNRDDGSLNLGTNTAFPSGIKAILSGFDNTNAGDSSLEYFNGKVFEASFDAAANIIYFDHPTF